MFCRAISFNGDVSKWDVSSVTNMDHMFDDAHSFGRKLCGAAWVHSKASNKNMFEKSSGSILQKACTAMPGRATKLTTLQHITRRPKPKRELIVSTPFRTSTSAITSMVTKKACPNCGIFEKSGRVSCCAPSGAWFKNCGGVGNRNVDHRWFEGLEVCKRKSKARGDG